MKVVAKVFVARVDFVVGVERFAAGDVVPHGATLQYLLGFGELFVVENVDAREGKKDGV